MKKIGIITYPDIADGKGRFLQAYALYSYIVQLGYDVEIIDYVKKVDTSTTARIKRLAGRLSLKEVAEYASKRHLAHKMEGIRPQREEQRRKYTSFIEKNIKMSKRITSFQELEEYAEQFDALICGSDQIWNPYFIGLDPVYYLQFAPKEKRISYAASLGTTSIDKEKAERISKWIGEIPYCSVREESAKRMLDSLGCDVQAVMDPTFLMGEDWWNSMADAKRIIDTPYVLSLYFDNGKEARLFTDKLKQKHSLSEVNIPETVADIENRESIKAASLSPKEFVSLFSHAEYIVTQSFHAVVLSILFRKPFFVLDRTTKLYVGGVFSRIIDLLNKLGLENRIIRGEEDLRDIDNDIDYSAVFEKINQYASQSRDFINTSLEDASKSIIIRLASKHTCTGCGACMNICPNEAITMEKGEDGFLYPSVNDKCIKCHRCEQACPVKDSSKCSFSKPERVLLCTTKNIRLLNNSSSGGVFGTIAELFCEKGGAIAGCCLETDFQAKHIIIDNNNEINRLQKSKYVQSSIGRVFQDVKKHLENKQDVLFTGTPCQVAGLHNYLGRTYDNLYTMDIICHGVPSQAFLDAFIKYYGEKCNSKVIEYQTRDKKHGWSPQFVGYVVLNNGKKIYLEKHKGDFYKNAFVNNLSLRNSCYACLYSYPARISDITIADAWGIKESQLKEVDHKNGVSLVLVNTQKGQDLFGQINKELFVEEVCLDQFSSSQPALRGPVHRNTNRDAFLEEVMTNGVTSRAIKMAGEDEPKIKRIKHKLEETLGEDNYKRIVNSVKRMNK